MKRFLSRHRRPLAALLATAATAFGMAAARTHAPRVRVPVAARDLAAGTTLRARDVTTLALPAQAVPAGVVRQAVGRTLSGPMRRGEPLTDARLRAGGLLDAGDPAAVATPVRLADGAVARLLRPGDTVDVLAARTDDVSPARVVASAALVVAVPRPGPEAGDGALIVLRTGRGQAAALAGASAGSRLSVTIVGR